MDVVIFFFSSSSTTVALTILKCLWNKYANKEIMKITSRSRICKAFLMVALLNVFSKENDRFLISDMKLSASLF